MIPAIQYSDASKRWHQPGSARLTHYELRCGYVQEIDTAPHELTGIRLQLWHEGNCFHVRAHDFNRHQRLFWESYSTLTEANQKFFQEKKRLKL